MDIHESIKKTAIKFEDSFSQGSYYDSQTQDNNHLKLILSSLELNPGKRILDLGTGSGYLAFPLATENEKCEVIGLDIVVKTIERNNFKSKEITNLNFVSYGGEIFPFPENYFDIIVSRYAIHHFPDIEKCFSELSRVLRPKGQLFIADPTPNKLDKERFIDKYMQMKDDGHIKFYSANEIIDIAKKYNFEKKSIKFTKIRFPRKEAIKYKNLLAETGNNILEMYYIKITGDEVFISEDVLNISFKKNWVFTQLN